MNEITFTFLCILGPWISHEWDNLHFLMHLGSFSFLCTLCSCVSYASCALDILCTLCSWVSNVSCVLLFLMHLAMCPWLFYTSCFLVFLMHLVPLTFYASCFLVFLMHLVPLTFYASCILGFLMHPASFMFLYTMCSWIFHASCVLAWHSFASDDHHFLVHLASYIFCVPCSLWFLMHLVSSNFMSMWWPLFPYASWVLEGPRLSF